MDGSYYLPGGEEAWHATWVAGIIASTSSIYPGVADGVELYSANHVVDDHDFIIAAIQWARDQGVEVFNNSYWYTRDGNLDEVARYLDWIAFSERHTVVAAAGNEVNYPVNSPALAYNVIGVGGITDQNTPYWKDDVIWDPPDEPGIQWGSAFINPNDYREKPEVVAVAGSVMNTGLNNTFVLADGTSAASAQVSGLAALLMDQSTSLIDKPWVVKAVIMASAVHNIEGASWLSDKDGAGAIDAGLAEMIVRNQWWLARQLTNEPYEQLYTFRAVRGERVRVVISWPSHSDGFGNDELESDLDLYIQQPDGQRLWWSVSSANNFEIVDFTAQMSGDHSIVVRKYSFPSDLQEPIGIAWARDATYLPDVISDSGGWDSEIVVRNNGTLPRDVTISQFNESGESTGKVTYNSLGAGAAWTYNPGASYVGSAIVNGGEDLSVVVRTIGNGQAEAYNGLDAVSIFGFEPSGYLYLPTWLKGYYGWASYMRIQNAGGGSSDASVTAHYYDTFGLNGFHLPSDTQSIANGASKQFNVPSDISLSNGAVEVTADRRVAAVTTQFKISPARRSNFVSLSRGAATIYMPQVLDSFYSWTSACRVFNTTEVEQNVRLEEYDESGTPQFYEPPCPNPPNCPFINLPPLGVFEFYQGDDSTGTFSRSARILSGSPDAKLAVMCNEDSTNHHHQSYNGFISGAPVAYLPSVRNGNGWTTDIIVQATAVSQIGPTVRVYFYDQSGNEVSSSPAYTIQPSGFKSFISSVPSNFDGSAVVTLAPGLFDALYGDFVILVNQKVQGMSDGGLSYSGTD